MQILKKLLLTSVLMCPAFAENMSAPVSTQTEEEINSVEINDPLEPFNRTVYAVNGVIDGLVVKPLAITWRLVLPQEARDCAGNFFTNLKAPVTTVNHLLQGEPTRAAVSIGRFLINTTLGILGFFDAAEDFGISGEETTFNETLGRWGVNTGPYLIIPILGPSSCRHVVGMGGDYFMQPYNYYFNGDSKHGDSWVPYAISGTEAVHQRNLVLESVDDVVANSADPYATFRSAYFQYQSHRLEKLKKPKA